MNRSTSALRSQILKVLSSESLEVLRLRELAEEARKSGMYDKARELLSKAEQIAEPRSDEHRQILQRLAFCHYKDEDLPPHQRFDHALEILDQAGNLETTTDQETLGMAGAIYKNLWNTEARRRHLERSLSYYSRGAEVGPETDQGYTAINASFVLDLLADAEKRSVQGTGREATRALARHARAQEIRRQIVDTLAPRIEGVVCDDWWLLATLVEAAFGLGRDDPARYEDARKWLLAYPPLEEGTVDELELDTTRRQLVALANAQGVDLGRGAKARIVLDVLGDVEAIESTIRGKIGLGLSGGGFRASLFHIGMLARLAELDLLRHVEVISCVSGGSIVGAHYYLLLREELQRREKLTRDDYVGIVLRLLEQFLAGVQTNIRTHVAASFRANLKMVFAAAYSRTERVGELYESELFRQASKSSLRMQDLKVHPMEGGENTEDFHPRRDNSSRIDKVPVLVLNATTLNTGHNWQFTTSWVGEPPSAVDASIDNNEHMRRVLFSYAARKGLTKAGEIRLGQAVAASACVPGLFEPLIALDGLYPDRTVRLVDGGVHDNQGIAALLEHRCTHLVISDASGHMATEKNPDAGPLGVPMRSSSILQARVRLAQFNELAARERAGLLRGLVFLHLKKDLDVKPVQPDYGPSDTAAEDEASEAAPSGRTSYLIRKDLQALLANSRTDLDGFNDAEAFALMLSGYWMTDTGLLHEEGGAAFRESLDAAAPRRFWPFRLLEPLMTREHPEPDSSQPSPAFVRLQELLRAGSQSALKTWILLPRLRTAAAVFAGLLVLAALLKFGIELFGPLPVESTSAPDAAPPGELAQRFEALSWPSKVLGVVILGSLVLLMLKLVSPAGLFLRFVKRVGIAVLLLIFAWIPANLSLRVFHGLYLRLGRLDQLGIRDDLAQAPREEKTPDGRDDWDAYRADFDRAFELYERSRAR